MGSEGSHPVGTSQPRREDPALLTGEATYADDIRRPGMAHLAFARSRHAHARIDAVDVAAADAATGVRAVYTAADLAADDDVANRLPVHGPADVVAPTRPVLAEDRVRFQGEPIAAVVAEDRYAAREAADRVEVTYDRLPSATDPHAAVDLDGPPLHDAAPDNVAVEWSLGDADAIEAAIDDAEYTVTLDLANNRVLPAAMEPRAAVAASRPRDGVLEIDCSCQNPHDLRRWLAAWLSMPEPRVRVHVPAVGGGFGGKIQPYPEYVLLAWASRTLGQSVAWQATRSEDSAATIHGRDLHTEATLALDADGALRALRAETVANLGAYLSHHAAGIATEGFGRMLPGPYDLPALRLDVTGVFTNRTPLSAYRGAGRPEATYVMERLLSAAARELDRDPADFRWQNFVPPDAFPHETVTGHRYDSGDYGAALDRALAMLDYGALRERQERLRESGRYIGVGFSCFVDAVGGGSGDAESALVRVTPGGDVAVYVGPAENGQGHRTTYAQIAADALGVDPDAVTVIDGDTESVPESYGTGGSRSIPIGGSAVVRAAERVTEQACRIAAHSLEAAPEDLSVDDGTFRVRGAPERSLSLAAVAERAHAGEVPAGLSAGLEATTTYDPSTLIYPFGTHAAVVEVDPRTGDVAVEDFVAVMDVGVQVNPRLVAGQVHGGVVQGIGQALVERVVYDDTGNFLTGTFQDYALPRAGGLPEIRTASTETPCPHNPLGAKGVGESPAIGAPPAVVNAVVDALAPFGVEAIDMPLTAETVWTAIRDADSA